MIKFFSFSLLAWCLSPLAIGQPNLGFVQVDQGGFVLEGKPYKYIGTNLWYGMYLGAMKEAGGRDRLIAELDHLKSLGLSNLRIMAASEGTGGKYQNLPSLQTAPGIYNESLLQGLDFLLHEMGKREMKAVVCLGNFWMWTGGFAEYISWADQSEIPYPDIENGGTWEPFIDYAQQFYVNKKAKQMYHDHLRFIVNRTNALTGVKYRDDPTIMAWQLSNEPRGYDLPKDYRKWVHQSAKLIKSMDPIHLVSIGSEGNTASTAAGVDLLKDNKSKYIDYGTSHVWIQNWGWYQPDDVESFEHALELTDRYIKDQNARAVKLGKPVVIEEFGVSRDAAVFEAFAPSTYRDQYFELIFDRLIDEVEHSGTVQGCNFWSWGGMARPNHPGEIWQSGDPLIGDPAHELQGWYSVYHTDTTTLEVIERYVTKLQNTLQPEAAEIN